MSVHLMQCKSVHEETAVHEVCIDVSGKVGWRKYKKENYSICYVIIAWESKRYKVLNKWINFLIVISRSRKVMEIN